MLKKLFTNKKMDYKKTYQLIIDNAKQRPLNESVYMELHHIKPKCLGGSNESFNLVYLTYREHFICHWLLSLIHPLNDKLIFCFNLMCCKTKTKQYLYTPSSKYLEKLRLESITKSKTTFKKKKMKTKLTLTKEEKLEIMLKESLEQYKKHLEKCK
jgi:hypothetical protein